MKKQIVVIHGGDTFDTYNEYLSFLKDFELDWEQLKIKKWKDNLGGQLGPDFEIITPLMPNKLNAKYLEWEIWFSKLIPFLDAEIVLVGHSLGGIFLVKYLSENILPLKIRGVFLVAAPYDDKNADYSLADFNLSKDLKNLQLQTDALFIFHSQDDPVVPFADLEKYKLALPRANVVTFADRGHFNQAEFPELVHEIKKIFK